MCWTSQKWQTVWESIETSKVVLQWFSFTFTKVVWSRKGLSPYEKKYDAKLPKLYQIRGRADVTTQKMKFFIKDFFSKCDQIRRKMWIWSHLLKKFLMKNFNFWVVRSIFKKVQRAQIHENKNILVQCYSIFTSSTLYFFTNIPIINERVSISILVSTEKNHWGTTWCYEVCQIFKIARGDFRRCSIDVWRDLLTEMWRILWRWNNRYK